MIRLDRSLLARLVSGARLQGLIALFAVLIALRAIGQAAGAIDDNSLPIGVTLLVLLALVVVLAAGATGYAEADEAEVRWRYYLAHRYPWSDIEQVELQVVGVSIVGVRHLMFVHVGGRRRKITPGCGHGRGQLDFAAHLLALAAARGLPTVDGWRVSATPRPPAV